MAAKQPATPKAISVAIEDVNTGAEATYHRIESYTVDLRSKQCTVFLSGYISEKAFSSGRNPLMSHNVTVQGIPPDDVATTSWLYSEISKPATPIEQLGEVQPGTILPTLQNNVFAGADII